MSFFLFIGRRAMLLMFKEGQDFEWVRGETLFSSWKWPVGGALAYLLVVALLKHFIAKPINVPKHLISLHNLVLSIGSAMMFIGTLSSVIEEKAVQQSSEFVFCAPPDTQPVGRLYFWSYIYYLSKYYEFLDTVLLAARKKPTSFLHVFHHATVVIMAWLWVDHAQSLQFVGIMANTLVHVVMYYYYHLTVVGHSPWWKKYITSMQIVQFTSGFVLLPVNLYYEFGPRKAAGGCCGQWALLFNGVFNAALLALFVQFYMSTYKNKKATNGAAAAAAAAAVGNGASTSAKVAGKAN